GLSAPTNYATALAALPEAAVLERKPQAELAALQRMAAWAYQFSARVVLGEIAAEPRRARSASLWLEIGASLKLFGGFRALIERIEGELHELGYTYQLGVAPTLEGAALLARCAIRHAITTRQALHQRIRNLPISSLELDPAIVRSLHQAGVRTIGLLLDLPRDALARRFGPQLSAFLDRLIAAAPDARPAFQPPPVYRASFEFGFEVAGVAALLFPLRRMLHEFAGYLRARDVGVQEFTITLQHRAEAATHLRIGLRAPGRSADKFLELAREQLERARPSCASIAMSISADRFTAPGALQDDLFNRTRQNDDLSHTLDRLASRLGEEQVHALKCVADHRPEASWASAAIEETRPSVHFPDRPLWLLSQPQVLQLAAMPTNAAGPERIESGWWDGGDAQRDYFVVRTSSGADLWIYQDLSDRRWYLHGFWS